nr:PREDICTED: UDP-glucuronosyltransferase 2C1-like [Bemisia tabaci]
MIKRHVFFWACFWTAVFFQSPCDGEAYSFLFALPMPTKSHFTTNVVLAEELVRRGHKVTVLSPYPKEIPIFQEIIIDINIFNDIPEERNLVDHGGMNAFQYSYHRWNKMREKLDRALATREVQELMMSDSHYDVVLADLSFFQTCLLALGSRFNASVIDLSATAPSTFTASLTGNPFPFSTMISTLLPLSSKMSFWGRLQNTLLCSWNLIGEYLYQVPRQDALMRRHLCQPPCEHLPPLRKLLTNVSLVLVNTHFSMNRARPMAPNMVEVGGFHLKPPKPLPTSLQKFMDEANHGVIYFYLGSMVDDETLGARRFQSIITALGRLKQRVVFNWKESASFKPSANVLVHPWAPQQDILGHRNCVLMVTHGGQRSLIEVTWAGVPVLCIPVFSEQFQNVRFYEESGIGKRLDLELLTCDTLVNSINTIIDTPSFATKAKELARRVRDRPTPPLETAIFWIEYVARHGGAHHLKPSSVYMSYHEYLLLDVIFSAILVPLISLLAWKFTHDRKLTVDLPFVQKLVKKVWQEFRVKLHL